MLTLDVPEQPADGHEIVYWEPSYVGECVKQIRLLYVVGPRKYGDVIGPTHRSRAGSDFVNEWAFFIRSIPGESWKLDGRTSTEHLRKSPNRELGHASFAEARIELCNYLERTRDRYRREDARLSNLYDELTAIREPPP